MTINSSDAAEEEMLKRAIAISLDQEEEVEIGKENENATSQVSVDMRESKYLKYSKAMVFIQRRLARKLKCLIQ